ncbi:bifunctional acetate--CoA ligase family protein/GNAT family N-acetyltransferase [Actinocatenispora rupis]|uniref:GNAT family N-acetyltransferase n=1 Tax=Actinocatenispora rupis TaxID=519421 RepID=A0A8J3NFN9_9ACTN|nr:GNAT family N-acetyltransferase [Actinocatenispora rupis]GID15517.1 GNAT family N-acetyltransferase [Actinocatenispora rupis]
MTGDGPTSGGGVDALSADGHIVRIRPGRPHDAPDIGALLRGTSSYNRYLRFFSNAPGAVDAEIARLSRPPDGDHAVLVAEQCGDLLGVASYERLAPDRAELAVLVADDWHGRGVGTLLLEELSAEARRHGIDTLDGDVLAANTGMLKVSQGLTAGLDHEPAGVVHIQIATLPGDAALAAMDARDRAAQRSSLRPLFAPAAVAVIGAGRTDGVGHDVLRSLLDAGFTGRVYAVNPHARHDVAGVPAYRSALDLPEPVDLAVLAVPARAAARALAEAAQRGAGAAVVLGSGFGESGDGGRQSDLLRAARRAGVRIVGPNCLGVINTDPAVRLDASFGPHRPDTGGLAVASQSGAVGVALLDGASRAGIGVSAFVSLGNKIDVSSNDLLSFWYDDARTQAVALYLESFGNPARFARLARQTGRRKPVLVVKSGRSVGGRRAGAAHTAAAATPDAIVDSLFAQAGVIRTDDPDELLDAARLLVDQPAPTGDRLGVIGNAGGLNILAADAAEAAGLSVPELSGTLVDTLDGPTHPGGLTNPVDLGADIPADTLSDAVRTLARSGEVDCLVVGLIALRGNHPCTLLAAVAAALDTAPDLPAAVVLVGADDAPACVGNRRVPVYVSPERAVRALGRACRYARWRRTPVGRAVTPPGIDAAAVRAAVERAHDGGAADWFDQDTATRLLTALGVPLATGQVVPADRAVRAAESIGYPVAVKSADPHLLHKSDVGAVRLGIVDAGGVRAAASAVRAADGDADGRVLVQAMAAPGMELIAGLRHDPLFGPVVLLGAGGTVTELLGDRVLHLLPLTDRDAAGMWRALRTAPLLTGYRGSPRVDTAAVEDLLLRLSWLATHASEATEIDLNPVVVTPTGLTVVDAKVRLGPPTYDPDPYRRVLHGV